MFQSASLSVQIGPIAGHADGLLAMTILFGVVAVYALGPSIAAEIVRHIAKRWE